MPANANLTTTFRLVDEMSAKMQRIADTGRTMISDWEQAGAEINSTYGTIGSASSSAISSVDGVATSVNSLETTINAASSVCTSLTGSITGYGTAAQTAATQSRQLETSVEEYNSTAEKAAQAAAELDTALNHSVETHADLAHAMEEAASVSEMVARSDSVSAEARQELTDATTEAEEAFKELERAQSAAQETMAHYNSVLDSGTADMDELEQASREAAQAAEELTKADKAATAATERLSSASQKAGEEAQGAGEKGAEAFEDFSNALATLGIAKAVQEITQALIDCDKAAAVVQTSAAKVQTIMDSSQATIGDIQSSVRTLSLDTGIAMADLNNTVYDTISATSDTANSVQTVASAAKLATAGFAETGNALSVLATIMNSYKKDAKELDNISDSLIMTQNLGVTTVGDLSVQMGKAIATASAFTVDLYNLEAAYIATTKSGIATAESTTYISSMLNELGKADSDVAGELKDRTGKTFGQLMQDGMSLSDVLGILYDSVNGDAEAMMNLWGSAEAGKAAAAIINQGLDTFNDNLVTLQTSCGATESAYETMATTTEFAQNRMTNASEQLRIAIGDDLNPIFAKLYNIGADLFTGATSIVDKCPAITAGITAITAAGTAFLGIIGAVNVVIPLATVATQAFNAALALSPLMPVVLGVTAVTAAVVAFTAVMSAGAEEEEHWTATTIEQREELDQLTKEYEAACDTYGETSEQALRLKYQVDDLSASIQSNAQTLEQFREECEAVVSAHDDMVSAYEETATAQRTSEVESLALIQKLSDLADQTNRTEADTQAMSAIITDLNNSYDGLNLTLDDVINNSGDTVGALKEMAKAQAEAQQQQEAYENYVSALEDQARLEAQITDATQEQETALKQLNEAQEAYAKLNEAAALDPSGAMAMSAAWSDEAKALEAARAAYDEATAAVEQLNTAKEETDAILSDIEESWEAEAEAARAAADETSGATVSMEQAVSDAWGTMQSTIESVAKMYDEVEDAAEKSISKQYALWGQAADIAHTSAEEQAQAFDNINAALDSQMSYWETYQAAVENLQARNIDGLSWMVSSMNDGSEESAKAIQAMANASDEELTAMVEKYGDLQSMQSKTASSIADLNTDFSRNLDEISQNMAKTVDEMNMADDAATAAKSTMQGYIDEMKSQGGFAVMTAKEIASQISSALSSAKATASVPSVSIPGHATGTTNAENAFIAGENGPELIIGQQGATVFPSSETDRIISSLNDTRPAPEQAQAFTKGDAEEIVSAISAKDEVQTAADTSRFDTLLSDLLSSFAGTFSATAGSMAAHVFDSTNSTVETVSAYATGTTSSDDTFIAGEDGPELVMGQQGATVFPSSETDRIISALEPRTGAEALGGEVPPLQTEGLSQGGSGGAQGNSGEAGAGEKRIVIEIAGSGSISVPGGANKEEVIAIMQENLEPVLMSILQDDIFEEGEDSYEF